ncbi:MAG TPA: tryptophan halogenase family protein [Asticcacaulis sp.]|nr:tryptophan halogenase family protein [Asticcacaulis sp.]
MRKSVVIVGGGTAGWITADYLARSLNAKSPEGVAVTLVESAEIGILGVGEGTFPSIRRTLQRIGVDEAALLRECDATLKQGAKFAHWRFTPGQEAGRPDHYMHPFAVTQAPGNLDLLPYWLLGIEGSGRNWDEVNTVQKPVADAFRAPKRIVDPPFAGPLNYAYHFDAAKLAQFLRRYGIELGVKHVVDTVDQVALDDRGYVSGVVTRQHGTLSADLYVDCTGFRAELIGKALGVPYKPCRDVLFCDRAIALQVPYDRPDAPIASYTISTAHQAGWTWDIGLHHRRGIGHVYSADHMDDDSAEETLRRYIGPAADGLEARRFKFTAGFRETNWKNNCVAIGLSSGFFEPLEATGIIFAEVAAVMLSNLFPWGGHYDAAARQFNDLMLKRYERALDFIKLHYCLTERRDTSFWRDNADFTTVPDSLKDLLDRWRNRPPEPIDIDPNIDIFNESSWQYVLYGMGYRTDLSAKAGVYRYYDEARAEFADLKRQAAYAQTVLPTNRELIAKVMGQDFKAA